MADRFFVCGTLAPGRPNEHVLAEVFGTWEPATVKGTLLPEGWGAAVGFPGIVLDEFEGDGYERVVTPAEPGDGTVVKVHIYALKRDSSAQSPTRGS